MELAKRYEHWGTFHSRGHGGKRKGAIVSLVDGQSVLEVGCAEGWMTGELAARGAKVTAIDFAASYVERARAKVPNATIIQADVHDMPFEDNQFDSVVCSEVLEHLISPFTALAEIHRVLKPEGTLVISVPNGMSIGRILNHTIGNPKALVTCTNAHIGFYDVGALLQMLDITGFVPQKVVTQNIAIPLIGGLLLRMFPHIGAIVIVKAIKKPVDYWDRLNANLERRRQPPVVDQALENTSKEVRQCVRY